MPHGNPVCAVLMKFFSAFERWLAGIRNTAAISDEKLGSDWC